MKPGGVAVIGLGSMGSGMARALIRAGLAVRGYDIAGPARDRLAADGGAVADSPAGAAAGAGIVVTAVVNAAQTEAALLGPDGALSTASPGAVVISTATMAPQDCERIAAAVAARGFHYVDAPISGGSARAEAGTLTVMAAGSPEALAAARPTLDAMAETVHVLGDRPGIGAAFKMVNQHLAGIHIAAACEAITFAARLGLDLPQVYRVITGAAGNSWMFENRIPHVLDGDYQPRSAVSIFTKDLGIVADMGHSTSFPLPMAATALQMFVATAAAGMARDDDASVARMIAGVTGVALPGPKES